MKTESLGSELSFCKVSYVGAYIHIHNDNDNDIDYDN